MKSNYLLAAFKENSAPANFNLIFILPGSVDIIFFCYGHAIHNTRCLSPGPPPPPPTGTTVVTACNKHPHTGELKEYDHRVFPVPLDTHVMFKAVGSLCSVPANDSQ